MVSCLYSTVQLITGSNCSKVFPHEVPANSTLNAGVGYLLWSHGMLKHRRAEQQLPPLYLLPFLLRLVDKSICLVQYSCTVIMLSRLLHLYSILLFLVYTFSLHILLFSMTLSTLIPLWFKHFAWSSCTNY